MEFRVGIPKSNSFHFVHFLYITNPDYTINIAALIGWYVSNFNCLILCSIWMLYSTIVVLNWTFKKKIVCITKNSNVQSRIVLLIEDEL